MAKPKVLFVYDHQYPDLWRDGLWAALKELEDDFDITWWNLAKDELMAKTDQDFVLGWGGFNSFVDVTLREQMYDRKKGLCIGGNAFPPAHTDQYDVLFYETEWYRPQIEHHPNPIHAFGVNTDIYRPLEASKHVRIFDWLTVGAFADWKRQERILNKDGIKMAVGEIQKGNPDESNRIVTTLLAGGCACSDMVNPETLAYLYNFSRRVYIPADLNGGGERAVLEARACGVPVEVESDNPKLQELLTSPIWSHHYYAEQLRKGIESCL